MNTEAKLAWMLAEATAMRLTTLDRARLYTTLGAGETLMAIRHMLVIAVSTQHRLSGPLVAALTTWADGYVGTVHEPPIRNLLTNIRCDRQDSNRDVRRAERRLVVR